MLGHPFDDGAADAARRAGDDGDLAGKIEKRQGNLPKFSVILRRTLAARALNASAREPVWSVETHPCYASVNTNARERPWRPSIP
jgi:hypothetical protein